MDCGGEGWVLPVGTMMKVLLLPYPLWRADLTLSHLLQFFLVLIKVLLLLIFEITFSSAGYGTYISFPCPVTKYPDKSNLGDRGLILAHSTRSWSHRGRDSRQESDAAGHIIAKSREQMHECSHSACSLLLYSLEPKLREGCHPLPGWVFPHQLT